MCQQQECGGRCRKRASRGAEWFATIGAGVLILAHIAGILQGIKDVLIGIGSLVVGAVVGYFWIRARLTRMRMMAALREPQPRQQVPYRHQPPVEQPRQQALPEVHHHHGHTLVVSDPEQVAQFLGRNGQQG